MPQIPPPIGADVTALMPKVGDDVTALMGSGGDTAPPEGAPSMNFVIVNGQRLPVPPDVAAEQTAMRDRMATGADQGGDVVLDNLRAGAGIVQDVVTGAYRQLVKQGVQGGAWLRKIPGVNALDAIVPPVERQMALDPGNTAQRVGAGLLSVAEVAAPSRGISTLAAKAADLAAPSLAGTLGPTAARLLPQAAVEAAGSAGLAKVQGATTPEAAVSGALGAAIPTIGQLAVSAANQLRTGAIEDVAQFFSATTKPLKRVVERRTPEMLARGGEVLGTMGRTREGATEFFGAQRERMGEVLDEALSLFGSDVVQDAPQRVIRALEEAKAPYLKFRDVSPAQVTPGIERYIVERLPNGGARIALPLNPKKVNQIEGLQALVEAHGPQMTVDDLVGLRRAWDEIAYRPGASMESVKNNAERWAKKMGGDSIRRILDTDAPHLQELNREFSFWKDLEHVMSETVQRKRPQVGGLLAPIAETGGRAVGAALGSTAAGTLGSAYAFGKLAKLAQRVVESPRYASVSAQIKTGLANALMSGNEESVASWLRQAALRVGIVEGPQLVGGPAVVGAAP